MTFINAITEPGTKYSNSFVGNSAMSKPTKDEPVFVLRAQDALAPALVRVWISLAETHGVSPEKLMSAQQILWAMLKWPNRKIPD